jgi:hypothetical protein
VVGYQRFITSSGSIFRVNIAWHEVVKPQKLHEEYVALICGGINFEMQLFLLLFKVTMEKADLYQDNAISWLRQFPVMKSIDASLKKSSRRMF